MFADFKKELDAREKKKAELEANPNLVMREGRVFPYKTYSYCKTGLGSPAECVKYFTTPPGRPNKVEIIQYKSKTDKCYGHRADQTKTGSDISTSTGWSSLDLRPGYAQGGKYVLV